MKCVEFVETEGQSRRGPRRCAGRLLLAAMVVATAGCRLADTTSCPHAVWRARAERPTTPIALPSARVTAAAIDRSDEPSPETVHRASFLEPPPPDRLPTAPTTDSAVLAALIEHAHRHHPRLRQLRERARAATARVRTVGVWPEPMLGVTAFPAPIETAAGSLPGRLALRQGLPWLERLDAAERQAAVEALVAKQSIAIETVAVTENVRSTWIRLWVLERELDSNRGQRVVLESLVEIAATRVGEGQATQGDVYLGQLELSRLGNTGLRLREDRAAARVRLNRLCGRPPGTPVGVPGELPSGPADGSEPPALAALRELAARRSPVLGSATLREQAAELGIELAELERRPDVSVELMWHAINDDRPGGSPVSPGRDAVSIGVGISLPIYGDRYDAINDQAAGRHAAATAAVDDVRQQIDASLAELREQLLGVDRSIGVYRREILPRAKLVLEADTAAWGESKVSFDRVIGDVRTLLQRQLDLHRELGRRARLWARLAEVIGSDLDH